MDLNNYFNVKKYSNVEALRLHNDKVLLIMGTAHKVGNSRKKKMRNSFEYILFFLVL